MTEDLGNLVDGMVEYLTHQKVYDQITTLQPRPIS